MTGKATETGAGTGPGEGQRIDKWLWHARFIKTRSLATRFCQGRRVRVNRAVVSKPSQIVRVGDVLTFPQGGRIRIIAVRAFAARRGPASEARLLYCDLAPAASASEAGKASDAGPAYDQARRAAGAGRPTKRERRATDRLKPAPSEGGQAP